MNDLIPDASASTDVAPAPPMAWQSMRGPAAGQRQWWSVGVVAGSILLVGGGILAVLIARSGSGSSDAKPSAPLAQVATMAPVVEAQPREVESPTVQRVQKPTPQPEPQRTSPPPQPATQVAIATPATQPVPVAVAVAQPEPKAAPPQLTTAPTPPPQQETQPATPTPPAVEDQPIPNLPDTIANRPLRAYFMARQWAAKAKAGGNAAQIEKGARALILWHDFFEQSPHAEHVTYIEESQKLAEQYSPGITNKPRVQPTGGGPPLPPKPPAKPAEEPPQKPARPPLRKPTR